MDAAGIRDTRHPHERAYHGAFFGRRKGKALRAGQAKLLETLCRAPVDLQSSWPPAIACRSVSRDRSSEIRLEIGFGGAEHLIAQAAQ